MATNHPKRADWYSDTRKNTQIRRALKRWHGYGGKYAVTELYRRNAEILRSNREGTGQRELGRRYKLNLFAIQNAIKRAKAQENIQLTNLDQEIMDLDQGSKQLTGLERVSRDRDGNWYLDDLPF